MPVQHDHVPAVQNDGILDQRVAHRAFAEARRAMLLELTFWLATQPRTGDIEAEINGTISAICQMVEVF